MGVKAALLFGLLSSLIIAGVCLIWPEKVQEYALKWSGQGLGRFNPFLNWMKTKSYILSIRFVGVLAIISFIFLIIAFFRNTK